MEEMNVVGGQTILSGGEKPPFFFMIKDGKFKVGGEEYSSGSFVGVVEYFLELPMDDDAVAQTDGTIIKFTDSDVKEEEGFEKVLKYLLEAVNALILGTPGKEVVTDFEKSVDVAKIAELVDVVGEDELLIALEEMISLQKLPDIPDEPEKARSVIEMISKEEDILRYVLHRLAFVKKFPHDENSKEYVMDAIRVYMDDLQDKYGAKYSLKLAMLYYSDDDDLMEEVLKNLVKVMRESRDPEWFDYLLRYFLRFGKGVKKDEIS